jgi:TolB-like protein
MLVLALVGLLGMTSASAQEATVADKLAEALDSYNNLDYDGGIKTAKALLERANLTPNDSVAVFEVLGIITYAKGEAYLKEAFGYLDKISKVGPCVMPLPHEIWPQELRDQWYRLLKAKDALSCEEPRSDIITIAVMKFDNYSAGKYQEELGLISKGLADFFAYDFAKISSFKVIERDKIDFILKEIELQQSGAVDRATAVKVGKILGAKYMVFGSITQLDERHTRMVVRVVSVESSEIIALVDREGRPDYSKMEKAIVADLAAELDVKLSEETMGLLEEGGTDSYDATTYYSMGLEFMDKYDYKQAYEHFKKAYELDNTFVEARRKMEIYRPLAG